MIRQQIYNFADWYGEFFYLNFYQFIYDEDHFHSFYLQSTCVFISNILISQRL